MRAVRRCALVLVLAPLGFVVPASAAPTVTGYLTLTTDHVYRGVSQSDSSPAVQLGIDVETESGLFLGVWGSTAEIPSRGGGTRDWEADYYLGYNRALGSDYSVGVTAVRYTYPWSGGGSDYDYNEYAASLNLLDRLWLEFSWTPELYGSDSYATNTEGFLSWPLHGRIDLGVGAGYFDTSDLAGEGYWHWQAGLTRSFDGLSFDLRYHDSSDAVPRVSSPDRADARIVVSISARF